MIPTIAWISQQSIQVACTTAAGPGLIESARHIFRKHATIAKDDMDTCQLSKRLLPELELEFGKTRKLLTVIPDGHNDFKSHEKSMPLSRLAGHTAEFAGIITVILTHDSVDMGTPNDPRKILRMDTRQALLAEFNDLAEAATATLRRTSDEAFDQTFTLARKGALVFSDTRYTAYRYLALNHMIHHRAQLGVYLRLLDVPVPGTFGPSADEHPPAPPTAAR